MSWVRKYASSVKPPMIPLGSEGSSLSSVITLPPHEPLKALSILWFLLPVICISVLSHNVFPLPLPHTNHTQQLETVTIISCVNLYSQWAYSLAHSRCSNKGILSFIQWNPYKERQHGLKYWPLLGRMEVVKKFMSDDHYFLSVTGRKITYCEGESINYVDFLRRSVKVWPWRRQKKNLKWNDRAWWRGKVFKISLHIQMKIECIVVE